MNAIPEAGGAQLNPSFVPPRSSRTLAFVTTSFCPATLVLHQSCPAPGLGRSSPRFLPQSGSLDSAKPSPLLHKIPAKASFAKLLASERKAPPAAGGRHKKDISGWASATPTRFNAEGEPISDEDDDDDDSTDGFDIEELQAVLSRGRNKERLTALDELRRQAVKGGASGKRPVASGRYHDS